MTGLALLGTRAHRPAGLPLPALRVLAARDGCSRDFLIAGLGGFMGVVTVPTSVG